MRDRSGELAQGHYAVHMGELGLCFSQRSLGALAIADVADVDDEARRQHGISSQRRASDGSIELRLIGALHPDFHAERSVGLLHGFEDRSPGIADSVSD